jgi:hypothetical protein
MRWPGALSEVQGRGKSTAQGLAHYDSNRCGGDVSSSLLGVVSGPNGLSNGRDLLNRGPVSCR